MARTDADLLARSREVHWPSVRAELEAGRPCPLGIVAGRGANPWSLRHNHVVLAHAYTTNAPGTVIEVYDPNHGPLDGVHLEFGPEGMRSNIDIGRSVRGFFPLRYRPRQPLR